jgi:hypothetical protein
MSSEESSAIVDQNPEQDLQILPQMITAWKQIQNESKQLQEQIREKKTRQKALEEVILRVMKKHQIGALDLKASNGRLLHQTKKSKGSLTQRGLQDMLGEFMKSEEQGKKAIEFINEKRGVKMKEVLTFETL